uniref:Dimethyladenosine transferase 1, mitochondrial n=1 Tax=Knipowitschia caucasica TaxID=637954 RepID=A0AAV2JFJ9_KNICA
MAKGVTVATGCGSPTKDLPCHIVLISAASHSFNPRSLWTFGAWITPSLSPVCFQVDVGVVHFTPLVQPQIQQPFKLVEKVVRNIFQFRRKHFYKGLEKLFPEARRVELTQEVIQRADLDPTLRSTELTIPQFRALCDAYADLCSQNDALIHFEYREELRVKNQEKRNMKNQSA